MFSILKRINYFFKRVCNASNLSWKALMFAFKHREDNAFCDLYRFRKGMELNYISPFYRWKKRTSDKIIQLSLPVYDKRSINVNLNDPFQMAICREFILEDLYDLRLVDFEPELILDCGTYKGYFSLKAMRVFPTAKLMCFEPHQGNAAELAMLFKDEIKFGKIELIQKALSSETDQLRMEKWGSNTQIIHEVLEDACYIDVPAFNLNLMLQQMNKNTTLLLKMDIEGSEKDFFPSCISSLPSKCAVFLELHYGPDYLNEMKLEFEKNGFNFRVISDRGLYTDIFAKRNC